MAFDSEHPETEGMPPAAASRDDAILPIEGTLTAFIGRAQRGPVNRAIAVGSYEEYRRVFGGNTAFSHLSHAVLHYFQNGGQHAVIVRAINRGRRASLALPTSTLPLKLRARHPGAHELIRVSVDHDEWSLYPSRFNLTVQRVARQGSQLVEDQEIFRGMSVDASDPNYLGKALAVSNLITVEGSVPDSRPLRTVANSVGEPVTYLLMEADGYDGEELTDYDIIGSREESTGLFALDRVARFDLLCIPAPPSGRDLGITSLVAAERYCAERHAMLIIDPPASWRSATAALLNARRFGFNSPNALRYYPRLTPKVGSERFPNGLPACGAVAGILARKDSREGMWASSGRHWRESPRWPLQPALARRYSSNLAAKLPRNVRQPRTPPGSPTSNEFSRAASATLHYRISMLPGSNWPTKIGERGTWCEWRKRWNR